PAFGHDARRQPGGPAPRAGGAGAGEGPREERRQAAGRGSGRVLREEGPPGARPAVLRMSLGPGEEGQGRSAAGHPGGGAPWRRSDVDRFLLAAMEAKGVRPVGDADKAALLRRLSFDLTGLPPTPAEVEAFLADETPAAVGKVVDRLLASRAFGERWGRHW